ncbi:hypothetical protein TNCV_2215061 [Trichonephila clavipes]|nr:hypothetical protein TNCV_2215061 [Trichonephila clavipes]
MSESTGRVFVTFVAEVRALLGLNQEAHVDLQPLFSDPGLDSFFCVSSVRVLVPLKTQRVEVLLHISSVEAQRPLPGVGNVISESVVPAQVSSSSLDHGSKLRGPSSITIVLF